MNAPRNAAYRHIETERFAGALGAEVTGVDLSQDVSDEVLAEIRAALLENQVLVFRDQDFTPAQQLAFARRWGEIHFHPFMKGMADHPEILEIVKRPTDKKNFGGTWHTDQMFSPRPAMGTMLYAKEVPSAGGDTLFANLYLAYESLSDGMKKLAGQLHTVCAGDNFKHDGGKSRRDSYPGQINSMTVKDPGAEQTVSVHPLVRTHPETGRKALYVGARVRWRTGTLTFWDNRCTQHNAINDYPAETRVMHRITICGDTPF